jgi:hypothetical protein
MQKFKGLSCLSLYIFEMHKSSELSRIVSHIPVTQINPFPNAKSFALGKYDQPFLKDKEYKTKKDVSPGPNQDMRRKEWLRYLQDNQMRWKIMGKKIQDLKTLASQMNMLIMMRYKDK